MSIADRGAPLQNSDIPLDQSTIDLMVRRTTMS